MFRKCASSPCSDAPNSNFWNLYRPFKLLTTEYFARVFYGCFTISNKFVNHVQLRFIAYNGHCDALTRTLLMGCYLDIQHGSNGRHECWFFSSSSKTADIILCREWMNITKSSSIYRFYNSLLGMKARKETLKKTETFIKPEKANCTALLNWVAYTNRIW